MGCDWLPTSSKTNPTEQQPDLFSSPLPNSAKNDSRRSRPNHCCTLLQPSPQLTRYVWISYKSPSCPLSEPVLHKQFPSHECSPVRAGQETLAALIHRRLFTHTVIPLTVTSCPSKVSFWYRLGRTLFANRGQDELPYALMTCRRSYFC